MAVSPRIEGSEHFTTKKQSNTSWQEVKMRLPVKPTTRMDCPVIPLMVRELRRMFFRIKPYQMVLSNSELSGASTDNKIVFSAFSSCMILICVLVWKNRKLMRNIRSR